MTKPPTRSSRRKVLRTLGAGITGAIGLGTLGGSATADTSSAETDRSETGEARSKPEAESSATGWSEESFQVDRSVQDPSPPPGFQWFRVPKYQYSILYRSRWWIRSPTQTINEGGLQHDPVRFHAESLAEQGVTRHLIVQVSPTNLTLEAAYQDYVTRLAGLDPNYSRGEAPPLSTQLPTGQPALVFSAMRANPEGRLAISMNLLSVVKDRLYAVELYGFPDIVVAETNPHVMARELDTFFNVEMPTIIQSFGVWY